MIVVGAAFALPPSPQWKLVYAGLRVDAPELWRERDILAIAIKSLHRKANVVVSYLQQHADDCQKQK
jgi:hypothetical protein